MTGLVIDASIVLAWYFADEVSPPPTFLDRLIGEPVVVPSHFHAELANGVVIGERRGRSLPQQAVELATFIADLDIERDDAGNADVLLRVLPLARAHKLTIYDALYLELAQRRGLPVATRDDDLFNATVSIGLTAYRA